MKREVKDGDTFIQSYNSINEFYDYLCKTPFNAAFRWAEHSSSDKSTWKTMECKTSSFEEATTMMKNGWDEMASKLQKKLQSKSAQLKPAMQQRNTLSVQGYQPVVPLYLAGAPQNMVSKQMRPVKQKVVNIVKLFNYNGGIKADQIEEESIKVMQLVQRLERQGTKCNVYIALGTKSYTARSGRKLICKIKIKGAAERLNISKLAFPMVHPSMLRRLMFRYIEVCPDTTNGFVYGYGSPIGYTTMKSVFADDIVIPSIWDVKVEDINNIEDITGKF